MTEAQTQFLDSTLTLIRNLKKDEQFMLTEQQIQDNGWGIIPFIKCALNEINTPVTATHYEDKCVVYFAKDADRFRPVKTDS